MVSIRNKRKALEAPDICLFCQSETVRSAIRYFHCRLSFVNILVIWVQNVFMLKTLSKTKRSPESCLSLRNCSKTSLSLWIKPQLVVCTEVEGLQLHFDIICTVLLKHTRYIPHSCYTLQHYNNNNLVLTSYLVC